YKYQLPMLKPEQYSLSDLDYIVPRVLALQFSSESLRPWAEAVNGAPIGINREICREKIRAELDAYYALLYRLDREELQYILDPEKIMGVGWPSVTFPGLKNNEIAAYGEYRTERLVLEA